MNEPHIPIGENQAPKVLVIERNKSIRQLMESLLERFGYVPILASTEEEAMNAIEKHRDFGAVILGGALKEKNTGTFDTKNVLEHILQQDITDVIVAASASPDVCREMMKAGCTHSCENGLKVGIPAMLTSLVPTS